MTEKPIKCGGCKAALELITNDQRQQSGVCPRCGNTDTIENIKRIVGEYVKEEMAAALNKSLRDAARGSSILKVTSHLRPKGGHRFVVDLDLAAARHG